LIQNNQTYDDRVEVHRSANDFITVYYRDLAGRDATAKAADLKQRLQDWLDVVTRIDDMPDGDVIKENRSGTIEEMGLTHKEQKEGEVIRFRDAYVDTVEYADRKYFVLIKEHTWRSH